MDFINKLIEDEQNQPKEWESKGKFKDQLEISLKKNTKFLYTMNKC